MTRLTLVAAALIAAAVAQTQAASARQIAPPRAATRATADSCVRAPAVGAYASAPYKQPPCLPSTTTMN
ncbi:hypothetical protein ACVIWV_001828 [Bradyrhizobium diazoefficiens]|uniref:hypothetical protein n=1 Tax=Bradyrhizobium TaxID=374 RepID=UPI0009E88FD4|nr:hypothetical protein [Bradyrhizobium diazoefficiens]MBR0865205.1 hypothetical protein [Bradyrhizobium diazoefficiens]MBR0889739.1 hypothetical protein [Bradyrhizobium diazoefficiens]MBR0921446.1 hypothetical protein [Bradyrhizobium diazoefficiens]